MKMLLKSLAVASTGLFLFAVHFDRDAKLCRYDLASNDFVATEVRFGVQRDIPAAQRAASTAHEGFCRTVSTTPHALLEQYVR